MAILELKNIAYTYGAGTPFQKEALRDISLTIEDGDYVGLIGHTGSGKSTLIRHLNGLLQPTSGQVFVNGQDIWKQPEHIRSVRFTIGLVFQYPETQIFEDTIYKDVAYGPTNMGLSKEEIDQRVREAIHFAGLDDTYLERNPFRLSGGELRRVAIAGVIAMRPKVLVLDEPTAGLDPEGRKRILEQIDKYRQTSGRAVILVSHSMEEVAEYVGKVVVLNEGNIVLSGDTRSVFAQAETLASLGLDLPQITKVLVQLKAQGYSVDTSALTVAEAEQEILRLFKKGG